MKKELSSELASWTLAGQGGLEMTILNYGGTVQKLLVPDHNGDRVDVVLGFDKPEQYLGDHPYFGATAGRIAGRVHHGDLLVDGKSFQLPINDPPHHLHGGVDSIDRKIWEVEELDRKNGETSIKMTLVSEDSENGYPGRVEICVMYTITDDNHFIFETEARSNQKTPVSLTHHSYFNLSGEGSAKNHTLRILSKERFEADDSMGLTGQLKKAHTTRGTVKEILSTSWLEHGDLYWLGESDKVRPVAILSDPLSGRSMEVATDCPCVQFYGGMGLDGTLAGKLETPYQSGAGVCLECEGYPNAFGNEHRYGSILVEPGKVQKTRTEYRFSNQKP